MKPKPPPPEIPKARTGIAGFDEITHGGIPRGRVTLLESGAGGGKTLMALQTLVSGARDQQEPGIFVAFEESAERIVSNAASFGWDLPGLQRRNLFFLDAQPSPDLIAAGDFDLGGMLAALEAKAARMGAKRLVFDALDMVLGQLTDPLARRREIFRLHDWLLSHGFTAIITAKGLRGERAAGDAGFMEFLVDCAVRLRQKMSSGVSQRTLRVVKYRGSTFSENAAPFLIGAGGLEVAGSREMSPQGQPVTSERISSGVERLDRMLGGGYFRGASILFTGFPGTAKSTLAGAFAEAACQRGEKTLLVSFDSDGTEVVRNLGSVNIRLGRFVKGGLLKLISARAVTGSAEIHLMQIKRLAREHQAVNVVIDPVSALGKVGNEDTAHQVAERLIDWTKAEGITLACTSQLDEGGQQLEGTPLQISTVADTWIHLSYVIKAGERNRALSIIKSRGTAHSNQVRELVLSTEGVTLADAYTAGGEVLMGTLRWEKERALEVERAEAERGARQRAALLEAQETELQLRVQALELELENKRAERAALAHAVARQKSHSKDEGTRLRRMRGGDES